MVKIVILGNGVTGTSLFVTLVENLIEENITNISIILIDKNKVLGPGLPYATDQAQTLYMNDNAYGTNLTLDGKHQFIDWLKTQNPEDEDIQFIGLDYEQSTLSNPFPPRRLFGRYCVSVFQETLEKARANNITVHVLNECEATEIQKQGSVWKIHLSNEAIIDAEQVILATGHMPSEKYQHLVGKSNYYNNPWQDLSSIPQDADVGVLGAGLSAIDTAKKLQAQGHSGKIIFISKHGALPTIKSPPENTPPTQFKYLTKENLDRSNLTLSQALQLFTQEFEEILKEDLDLEQIINARPDPKTWIQEQLSYVVEKLPRTALVMLDNMYYEVLPYLIQHLSEDDFQEFMHKYYPTYMRLAAGTIPKNAEELLVLFEKQQLEVKAGIASVDWSEEAGFIVQFSNDEPVLPLPVVINSTGMGHNLRMAPLLGKMLDDRLISSPTCGGVTIDTQTYQVIDPNTNRPYDNFYAAGPVTFGSVVAVYAIHSSAMASEIIAPHMVQALKAKQTTEHEPLIYAAPIVFFKKYTGLASDTTNLSDGKITNLHFT